VDNQPDNQPRNQHKEKGLKEKDAKEKDGNEKDTITVGFASELFSIQSKPNQTNETKSKDSRRTSNHKSLSRMAECNH
jgi:hypothetical protein